MIKEVLVNAKEYVAAGGTINGKDVYDKSGQFIGYHAKPHYNNSHKITHNWKSPHGTIFSFEPYMEDVYFLVDATVILK